MTDPERRARFRVSGRVQGVGFRWATTRQARALGVRGSVRNCPDGSVEVVAAGRAEDVEALRRWLRDGPPGAAVAEVEEAAAPPAVEHDGFDIIH